MIYNLYKLNEKPNFQELDYNCIGQKEIDGISLELYIRENSENKKPKWYWILEEFDEEDESLQYSNSPISIVIIKKNEQYFCYTFGSSYFHINKYVDYDFPMKILKRIEIKNVKNAGLINPGTDKYKNITIYRNGNEDILLSENAVEKVKINISDEEKEFLNLESNIIEFGNSIKFQKEQNLNNMVEILNQFEEVLYRDTIRKISEYELIKR